MVEYRSIVYRTSVRRIPLIAFMLEHITPSFTLPKAMTL